MNEYESLNHTKWECKYHVVFIPKYRRKALFGSLRKHLGSLFRELARHKECEIGEGHLMVDHVHNGGTQRSSGATVHPRAREGRPTPRSVGTVRWRKPL